MYPIKIIAAALLTSFLAACGSDDENTSGDVSNSLGAEKNQRCESVAADVNWQKLLTENAPKLSEYNLFQQGCNPTASPNPGGFPYDLTTPLFTDYSTKYRYIFIPDGSAAAYTENEVLEFPVGSVLVKTFALPKDTALRGFESSVDFDGESLIETRLLIHREAGWLALPYVWNQEQTDAVLQIAGKTFLTSTIHKGEQKEFTYAVPDIQTCKQCHQLTNIVDGETSSRFAPIGPKARLLNRDLEFPGGSQNQLAYMVEHGLLTGAPVDLTSIDTIPVFKGSTDISNKTPAELQALAKGYLDINCAHCHRRTGAADQMTMDGKAGYSGLKLEFWRDFATEKNAHGICKRPIAYSVQGLGVDIMPGSAGDSILPHRMQLKTAKKMPEAGRDLVHEEGVALIHAWINSMPVDNCQ